MAHKCINTRDLIKSNKHWRFVQWVMSFKIKRFRFGKKERSLGELLMTGFILGICMCEGVGEDSGHRIW